jgi:hypothetical protein
MIRETLLEIGRLAEQLRGAKDADIAAFAACVILMSQALQERLGTERRVPDKRSDIAENNAATSRQMATATPAQGRGIGTNASSPRLLELLVERFMTPGGPGSNVLIRRTCLELFGAEPTPDEFQAIAKAFDYAMQRDKGFSPFPTPLSPPPPPTPPPPSSPISALTPSPNDVREGRELKSSNPRGDLICCLNCGSDTRAKSGYCAHCMGHGNPFAGVEQFGRRARSTKVIGGSPIADADDGD